MLKAILLLESEIELLKLIFQKEHLYLSSQKRTVPKVYFVPKPKEGLGIDSMGEIAVSFELSGQFINNEGNSAPLILIAETLERAFNFSFGDVYKSKFRIFKRKPFNLTNALDFLKNLLERESRKKKMEKDDFAKY